MRKATKKVIAGACAAIMMASCFAACSGKLEDNTTTSAPETSESVQSESESQAPSGSESQAPSGSEASDAPANGNVIAKPSSKDAAAKLFNDAIAKTPVKKADMKREMVSGVAKAGISINLATLDPNIPKELAKGNGPLSAEASKLNKMDASDIKSMTASETATEIKMTIQVNDATGNANTSVMKGYQYFISFNDLSGLASSIGKKIAGDDFEIAFNEKTAKIVLSGGKLDVTVDKATGKFKSIKYSANETVTGKITCSEFGALELGCEIVGKCSVDYTF